MGYIIVCMPLSINHVKTLLWKIRGLILRIDLQTFKVPLWAFLAAISEGGWSWKDQDISLPYMFHTSIWKQNYKPVSHKEFSVGMNVWN